MICDAWATVATAQEFRSLQAQTACSGVMLRSDTGSQYDSLDINEKVLDLRGGNKGPATAIAGPRRRNRRNEGVGR
jgi:hypothetical protein